MLISTGAPVAREEERIGNTTTMPMPERRPSIMNSFLPVEIPPNSTAGQQRLQISELQFDKFPTPSSFMSWKIRFKTQVCSCSQMQCYGSKKWRWSIQLHGEPRQTLARLQESVLEFPEFRDAGREDCLGSEQDRPDFPVQKEGQPRGAESPEGGPVSTRKTDRLHDPEQLLNDWCSRCRSRLR